jgi:hypothetical protein
MNADEFRRRAANYLRWAEQAANERTKALWLNMAQVWLDRAENRERDFRTSRTDQRSTGRSTCGSTQNQVLLARH